MPAEEVEVVCRAGRALPCRGLQAMGAPPDPPSETTDYVGVRESAESSGYDLNRSDPAAFYDRSAQESPHDVHAPVANGSKSMGAMSPYDTCHGKKCNTFFP